ncbi:AmmeMemoRadiSam system protein A [Malaciobacter mytili]|uniref:AmmeMemoRadiSam system protein A n=1 Tax=Malaciobacter mytili TaxID=603050 RepID=UPI003BAFF030
MDLKILLDIARKSIYTVFDKSLQINKDYYISSFKELEEQKATFITLTLNGNLRGCIGSLVAHNSLYDDVFINARKAAFNDPRFNSLSYEEFNKIKIEVSILTPAKLLNYSDIEDLKQKIIPYKHGVILKYKNNQATFLPQVWEQLNTFEEFISSLCKKANLDFSILYKNPEICLYEAIKVKE